MILTGPDDQPLPFGYRWAVVNGLTSFTPWHILDSREQIEALSREFILETGLQCWAFASRQDMDDVAAFVVDRGVLQDAVVSAHLSWAGSPDAFVRVGRYASFWEWLFFLGVALGSGPPRNGRVADRSGYRGGAGKRLDLILAARRQLETQRVR